MIRRAEKADIPALSRLLCEVHAIHAAARPDIFKPGVRKFTDGELEALIDGGEELIYVCERGGEVLAHAFCEVQELAESGNTLACRVMFIHDLCVSEKVRGAGIGRRMYSFAADEARKMGCVAVRLNVWAFNENAMEFYRSLGMKPLSVIMEEKL